MCASLRLNSSTVAVLRMCSVEVGSEFRVTWVRISVREER